MIRAIFLFTAFFAIVFFLMFTVIGAYEFAEFMGAEESANKWIAFKIGAATMVLGGFVFVAYLVVAVVVAACDPKSELREVWRSVGR